MNCHPRSSTTRLSLNRITASVLALVLLTGCGKARHQRAEAQPELSPVQVRTTLIQTRSVPAIQEVVGTVRAKLRATIEAKASGRIVELPVALGQMVKTGDLLVRLEAPEIQARLEQGQAALQQADRDWKRISSLYHQQASTRAEYDAAESRLELAKAAVGEARALLDYVEVKAPFDGVVTRKVADVGDLAGPGKPLVEVEDPSRLQIEADLPEAFAGQVRCGARMLIRLEGTAAELTAAVAEIAPNADPFSRTFRVKLDLPADHRLRSGQFARLAVPVGETTTIRVPSGAVILRGQMEIVFAIENQHARLRLVKTGRQFKGETEILSGLEPGDLVVVDEAGQLIDGQPVITR